LTKRRRFERPVRYFFVNIASITALLTPALRSATKSSVPVLKDVSVDLIFAIIAESLKPAAVNFITSSFDSAVAEGKEGADGRSVD
jgi:hypothetical protein